MILLAHIPRAPPCALRKDTSGYWSFGVLLSVSYIIVAIHYKIYCINLYQRVIQLNHGTYMVF